MVMPTLTNIRSSTPIGTLPSSEHYYEEVQHEQIKEPPTTVLSRRSPLVVGRARGLTTADRGSAQRTSNQTTAAPQSRGGTDTKHPHGTTMQPPRVLPRLQRNIGPPLRTVVGAASSDRAHDFSTVPLY